MQQDESPASDQAAVAVRMNEIALLLSGKKTGRQRWIAIAVDRDKSTVRRWFAENRIPRFAIELLEERVANRELGQAMTEGAELETATGMQLDGFGLIHGIRRRQYGSKSNREGDRHYRQRMLETLAYRKLIYSKRRRI